MVIYPHAVRLVLRNLRHSPCPPPPLLKIIVQHIFKVQYTLNWPKILNAKRSAYSTASHTTRSQTLFPWLYFTAPIVYPYWSAFSRAKNIKNIKAGTRRGTESLRWFLRLSYKLLSVRPRPSKQCPPISQTGGFPSLSPLSRPLPTPCLPRPRSETRAAVTSGLPLSSLFPFPGTSLRRRRRRRLAPAAESSQEQEERQTFPYHRCRTAELPAHPDRRVNYPRAASGPRYPGQGAGHTPAPSTPPAALRPTAAGRLRAKPKGPPSPGGSCALRGSRGPCAVGGTCRNCGCRCPALTAHPASWLPKSGYLKGRKRLAISEVILRMEENTQQDCEPACKLIGEGGNGWHLLEKQSSAEIHGVCRRCKAKLRSPATDCTATLHRRSPSAQCFQLSILCVSYWDLIIVHVSPYKYYSMYAHKHIFACWSQR